MIYIDPADYVADEPVKLQHGSARACHEGECYACEVEQAEAEALQES